MARIPSSKDIVVNPFVADSSPLSAGIAVVTDRRDQVPFETMRDGVSSREDRSRARGAYLAIAEIERFLPLRGRLGYTRSNRLMEILAERLVGITSSMVIGRVGRSAIEFAFNVIDRAAAEAVLTACLAAVERRLDLDGFEFNLSAVIGAVELGDDAIQDASVDLAAATVAEATRLHRRFIIADGNAAPARGFDELSLIRDMPQAMRSGALQVHYQPKLRVRSNRIDAAEALIRWTHPTMGKVPIEPFVRLVEQTGAIRRLTEWVIARAVLDRATLAANGHDITIWVNLSGLLLADAAFTARALELIEGSGGGIGVEVTETAVIEDPHRALANLAAFTAAGVKIAIDDYGSGLSSLAYLKQLPADELKIDRLFIKELVDDHRDPLLVRSSIDLAHALEMEVTAEGVDDVMALALLKIMGCDMVQGYLISEPVPLPRLLEVLRDHRHLDRLASPLLPKAWRAV